MATKEELEQQLEVARRDIETLATMAGGTVREQLQSGVARAGTEIEELSTEARALYDQARNEGVRMRRMTEEHIRSNPLATVGLAFAAGVLLSGLFGRK